MIAELRLKEESLRNVDSWSLASVSNKHIIGELLWEGMTYTIFTCNLRDGKVQPLSLHAYTDLQAEGTEVSTRIFVLEYIFSINKNLYFFPKI